MEQITGHGHTPADIADNNAYIDATYMCYDTHAPDVDVYGVRGLRGEMEKRYLEGITLDEAVQRALDEHAAWQEGNSTTDEITRRVPVLVSSAKMVWREPYKRKGEWYVAYSGHKRLIDPTIVTGLVTFRLAGVNYT